MTACNDCTYGDGCMDDGEWLSVSAAAKRLGVTRQTLQNRIKRGTIEHRRNNRGDPMILVAAVSDAAGAASWSVQKPIVAPATAAATVHLQGNKGATEMVSLSVLRDTVDRIQATHNEALAVAARNHKRSDAQSRAVFSAHSLRRKGSSDARCLRLSARCLRRARDRGFRRKIRETQGVAG